MIMINTTTQTNRKLPPPAVIRTTNLSKPSPPISNQSIIVSVDACSINLSIPRDDNSIV